MKKLLSVICLSLALAGLSFAQETETPTSATTSDSPKVEGAEEKADDTSSAETAASPAAETAATAAASDAASPAASPAKPAAKKSAAKAAKVQMWNAKTVKWQAAPAPMTNARMAVLEGNPEARGPYTIMLETQGDFRLEPHTHPTAERGVILSGALHMGTGDTFDKKATTKYGAGSYFMVPARAPHFSWSRGKTVALIMGNGPRKTNLLQTASAPATKAKVKAVAKEAAKPAAKVSTKAAASPAPEKKP